MSSVDQNSAEEFYYYYKNEIFPDCVLLCQGRQFKAHRIVLAACSEYFRNLLTATNNFVSIITITDLDADLLEYLLEFIYVSLGKNVTPEFCDQYFNTLQNSKPSKEVEKLNQSFEQMLLSNKNNTKIPSSARTDRKAGTNSDEELDELLNNTENEVEQNSESRISVNPLECDICHKVYSSRSNLNKHKRGQHRNEELKARSNELEMVCDVDPLDFDPVENGETLLEGQPIDTSVPISDEETMNDHNVTMQRQFTNHSKDTNDSTSRSLECTICHKTYSCRSSLNKHRRKIHERRNHSFQNHIKVHKEPQNHGSENAQTKHCSLLDHSDSSSVEDNKSGIRILERSIPSFSGRGPKKYTCQICFQTYRHNSSLQKHKRRKHKLHSTSSKLNQTK